MKKLDLCVAREYEYNGEKKTQWQKIGVAFEKDGKMWGELRLIPTNWDGRFQLFELKTNEQAQPQQSVQQTPKQQEAQQDDLPF